MTECKTWRQVDEKHFRPLCSNIFVPETGNDSCSACAVPQEFFGGCTGVDNCLSFRAKKSLVLDIKTDLTEAAHVYPRTGGGYVTSNGGVVLNGRYDWYDQYATAEQIGTPCVMTATSWSPSEFNVGCTWRFQQKFRRYYKMSPRYQNFDGLPYSEGVAIYFDYTDIDLNGPGPYTNPYTCFVNGGLYQPPSDVCRSVEWGWAWSFKITDAATPNDIAGTLYLERYVARHLKYQIVTSPYEAIVNYNMPISSFPGNTGSLVTRDGVPPIPSIGGWRFNTGGTVLTGYEAFPNIAITYQALGLGVPFIGLWRTPPGLMCGKERPWVLKKVFDANDGVVPSGGGGRIMYDSITNLPNEIKIDVGLF